MGNKGVHYGSLDILRKDRWHMYNEPTIMETGRVLSPYKEPFVDHEFSQEMAYYLGSLPKNERDEILEVMEPYVIRYALMGGVSDK